MLETAYVTGSAFMRRTFPSGTAARKLPSELDGPHPGDPKTKTRKHMGEPESRAACVLWGMLLEFK